MAAKLKMNHGSYVLLGLLVAVILWTRTMDQQTMRMKALAATAVAERDRVVSGPAGIALAPASATRALASLRVAPWGQDPFWKNLDQPSAPVAHVHRDSKPSGKGLKLMGILWGGPNPSAQIGESIARKGDTVYGWKVVEITPSTVTVVNQGVTLTLHLHEE